jgi:hypothetical protein
MGEINWAPQRPRRAVRGKRRALEQGVELHLAVYGATPAQKALL